MVDLSVFPSSKGPDPKEEYDRRDRKVNAATGASAAGVRALGSQLVAFYFRAPAKAFFRTRVDVRDSHQISVAC